MNSAAIEPVRWPARRWVYAVSAVFIAHAALVFISSHQEQRPPEQPIFRTAIHLIGTGENERQLAASSGVDDPTLLALPSLRGFSGPAWLAFPALEYQPAEWVEPPHWLSLNSAGLSSTFSRFVVTNTTPPMTVADKPLPPLPGYDPRFPNEPLPAQSRLRIEGDLAARPLVLALDLRSWTHPEILSNTMIHAAVDAEGFTFSQVLLHGSGSREADSFALSLAANARFRPLPREQRATAGADTLTWGRLVFQWHTLPLAVTNITSVQP